MTTVRPKIVVFVSVFGLTFSGLTLGAFASHIPTHTTAQAKGVSQVKLTSNAVQVETSSTEYTQVPNVATSVRVPKGETALLIVTFQSSVSCAAPSAGVQCLVRIDVNGGPTNPQGNFAWDTSGNGAGTRTAMRWTRVGPGTHDVDVLFRVESAAATHRLAGMTLRVERIL